MQIFQPRLGAGWVFPALFRSGETWVLLSEIYPTAIRGRALGLATFFLWMADYAVTQTFPMLDDKNSWFVQQFKHAFPFYIYAMFCLVLLFVLLKFVPETKGKSLEQIERAWAD